mgnify:FL=1
MCYNIVDNTAKLAVTIFKNYVCSMKRLSFIFFILCLCSFASYADERDIPIQSVNTNTRSISVLPEATIGNGIIFISFDASGVYSVYIEDSMGNIIYTSTLPADGMEYGYDLSGIGTGLLRLVIKGHGGEYEGFFNI